MASIHPTRSNRERELEAFDRLLEASPAFTRALAKQRRASATVNAQVFVALIAAGVLQAQTVLDLLERMGTTNPTRQAAELVREELSAILKEGNHGS